MHDDSEAEMERSSHFEGCQCACHAKVRLHVVVPSISFYYFYTVDIGALFGQCFGMASQRACHSFSAHFAASQLVFGECIFLKERLFPTYGARSAPVMFLCLARGSNLDDMNRHIGVSRTRIAKASAGAHRSVCRSSLLKHTLKLFLSVESILSDPDSIFKAFDGLQG